MVSRTETKVEIRAKLAAIFSPSGKPKEQTAQW